MLALHAPDSRPTPQRSLLQVVKDYLRFLDSGPVAIPYEARQELRRRHLAELRQAVEDAERRGSTLTEVLVAVLLFALGVLPILSLFVIAHLRTARATQLTRATNLRYSIEGLIDLNAHAVLADPDVDGDEQEHVFKTGPAGIDFAPERYFVDPLGWAQADADGLPAAQRDVFCRLARYNIGRRTIPDAEQFATIDDSFYIASEAADPRPRRYCAVLTVRKVVARVPKFRGTDPTPIWTTPPEWRIAGRAMADVDVVVFVNRPFDQPAVVDATFTKESQTVTLAASNAEARPGRWMLDCDNGRWYRIGAVDGVAVTLQTIAVESGAHAAFPVGVIEVFPLGVMSDAPGP